MNVIQILSAHSEFIQSDILIAMTKTEICSVQIWAEFLWEMLPSSAYVNLFYYKQRSLLHVSATYCDHLQGGVLWRIYYVERQNILIYKYKMLSFKLKFKIYIQI